MNGILLVDKPSGLTSHDVVNRIRRITGVKKVGHTGTLDPNATGLLVLCIGEATKLIPYLEEGSKNYVAEINFGSETDTDDITGTITKIGNLDTDYEKLLEIFPEFLGEQLQTVPLYSAKKVKGKKLYSYAREGKDVELPKNKITIDSINIVDDSRFPDHLTIEVSCSKGTYIRSLIRDIGRRFGTLANMGDLRRYRSNTFSLEDSVVLDDDLSIEEIKEKIIPLSELNLNFPKIGIDPKSERFLINGNQLYGHNLLDDIEDLKENTLVSLFCDNDFRGIGKIVRNKRKVIQPVRIFNY